MAFDPECNDCNEIAQEIQVSFIFTLRNKNWLLQMQVSPFSEVALMYT